MSRTTRSAETRTALERYNDRRPAVYNRFLSRFHIDPQMIPEGMAYCWIRLCLSSDGIEDTTNMQQSMVKGWLPVPGDRHPELSIYAVNRPGTRGMDPESGIIVNSGSVLMEKPLEDYQEDVRKENAWNDQVVKATHAMSATMMDDPTIRPFIDQNDVGYSHQRY